MVEYYLKNHREQFNPHWQVYLLLLLVVEQTVSNTGNNQENTRYGDICDDDDMNTKEREFRCQLRKCGTANRNRNLAIPKTIGCHQPEINPKPVPKSPNFCEKLHQDKRNEQESLLNLVSNTLATIEGRLSSPHKKKSRRSVKRVYVIKFSDENLSEEQKDGRKKMLYKDREKQEENAEKLRLRGRHSKFDEAPSSGSEHAVCEDPPKLYEHHQPCPSQQSKPIKKIDSTSTKGFRILNKTPQRNKIPVFNCRVSCREPISNAIKKSAKKSVTSEAISGQMDSVIDNVKMTTLSDMKSLSDIIDSNQSLLSTDYEIPSCMINKKTVDCLQKLIDRIAKKTEKITTTVSKTSFLTAPQFNDSRGNFNIGTSSSTGSGPICRICHGSQGLLAKPCLCRGTMAYVHPECLQVWLIEKRITSCDVCLYPFSIIHRPQECTMVPSLRFWYKFAATSRQKKSLLFDLSLAVALLPFLICFTIFVRSVIDEKFMQDETDEDLDMDSLMWWIIQKGLEMVTFLINLTYVGGVLVRVNHHVGVWLTWYVNNISLVLDENTYYTGSQTEH